MDVTTLLIAVYCAIDEWLAGARLRRRGPQPVLTDAEVLTIERVGGFLGIDTDKGIYEPFRRQDRDWFPALGRVHRTTFARQAAKGVGGQGPAAPTRPRPRPVRPGGLGPRRASRYRPAASPRAYRCRRLAGLAAFGRDEGAKQTCYGLRAHLRACWPGVVTDGLLAPANPHDLVMAEGLLDGVHGWALGDRAYSQPRARRAAARARGVAAGAAVAVGQGQGAVLAQVGDADQAAHRDGDRPAGRALPRQTGLGAGRLAPVVTLAAQAAQPHPGRLVVPTGRPRLAALRGPGGHLKPAHRVSYGTGMARRPLSTSLATR
jgi:hypothetical protein